MNPTNKLVYEAFYKMIALYNKIIKIITEYEPTFLLHLTMSDNRKHILMVIDRCKSNYDTITITTSSCLNQVSNNQSVLVCVK
jgi:hypothetical protein